MECNKDEATRAKAIAESKFVHKDYVGAKKFAVKARNMYPGLDGISQMLMVVVVYLHAENMIRGEVDWYRVLDVYPLADEDTIRKQYKKLALMLHPDKNRAFGAAGAFHLISHAYRLLTDRQRREAFDQRCRFFAIPLRAPILYCTPSGSCRSYCGGQSVPPGPSKRKVPSPLQRRSVRPKVNPAHAGGSSAAPQPTFWTVCSSCRIPFEYDRKYVGCTLRCQECYAPFLATDIGRPKLSRSRAVPWRRKSQSAN